MKVVGQNGFVQPSVGLGVNKLGVQQGLGVQPSIGLGVNKLGVQQGLGLGVQPSIGLGVNQLGLQQGLGLGVQPSIGLGIQNLGGLGLGAVPLSIGGGIIPGAIPTFSTEIVFNKTRNRIDQDLVIRSTFFLSILAPASVALGVIAWLIITFCTEVQGKHYSSYGYAGVGQPVQVTNPTQGRPYSNLVDNSNSFRGADSSQVSSSLDRGGAIPLFASKARVKAATQGFEDNIEKPSILDCASTCKFFCCFYSPIISCVTCCGCGGRYPEELISVPPHHDAQNTHALLMDPEKSILNSNAYLALQLVYSKYVRSSMQSVFLVVAVVVAVSNLVFDAETLFMSIAETILPQSASDTLMSTFLSQGDSPVLFNFLAIALLIFGSGALTFLLAPPLFGNSIYHESRILVLAPLSFVPLFFIDSRFFVNSAQLGFFEGNLDPEGNVVPDYVRIAKHMLIVILFTCVVLDVPYAIISRSSYHQRILRASSGYTAERIVPRLYHSSATPLGVSASGVSASGASGVSASGAPALTVTADYTKSATGQTVVGYNQSSAGGGSFISYYQAKEVVGALEDMSGLPDPPRVLPPLLLIGFGLGMAAVTSLIAFFIQTHMRFFILVTVLFGDVTQETFATSFLDLGPLEINEFLQLQQFLFLPINRPELLRLTFGEFPLFFLEGFMVRVIAPLLESDLYFVTFVQRAQQAVEVFTLTMVLTLLLGFLLVLNFFRRTSDTFQHEYTLRIRGRNRPGALMAGNLPSKTLLPGLLVGASVLIFVLVLALVALLGLIATGFSFLGPQDQDVQGRFVNFALGSLLPIGSLFVIDFLADFFLFREFLLDTERFIKRPVGYKVFISIFAVVNLLKGIVVAMGVLMLSGVAVIGRAFLEVDQILFTTNGVGLTAGPFFSGVDLVHRGYNPIFLTAVRAINPRVDYLWNHEDDGKKIPTKEEKLARQRYIRVRNKLRLVVLLSRNPDLARYRARRYETYK
jgi:hypothetical protein